MNQSEYAKCIIRGWGFNNFPYPTNQIIDSWCRRGRSRRHFSNSLMIISVSFVTAAVVTAICWSQTILWCFRIWRRVVPKIVQLTGCLGKRECHTLMACESLEWLTQYIFFVLSWRPFSLDSFDVYSKHFTVMNYKDSENLKTVLAPMNILKYTVIEFQKKR